MLAFIYIYENAYEIYFLWNVSLYINDIKVIKGKVILNFYVVIYY